MKLSERTQRAFLEAFFNEGCDVKAKEGCDVKAKSVGIGGLKGVTDLLRFLVEGREDRIASVSYVMGDWNISGRKGKRKMEFVLTTLVTDTDGNDYEIAHSSEHCYEDSKLTVEMPVPFTVFQLGN